MAEEVDLPLDRRSHPELIQKQERLGGERTPGLVLVQVVVL